MQETEIPPEFLRIGLAAEALSQKKFRRWAEEMRRHGWDAREPTPRKVRALAIQNAIERAEKAREDARA